MSTASFFSASTSPPGSSPQRMRVPADLYLAVCARATRPTLGWTKLPPSVRKVYEELFVEAGDLTGLFRGLADDRRDLLANRYAGLTPEGGTPVPTAELRFGTLALDEAERALYQRMEAFRQKLASLARAPDGIRDAGDAVAPSEHFGRDAIGSMAETRATPEPPTPREAR